MKIVVRAENKLDNGSKISWLQPQWTIVGCYLKVIGKRKCGQRQGSASEMKNKEVPSTHRPQDNQNKKPAALKRSATQVGADVRVQTY